MTFIPWAQTVPAVSLAAVGAWILYHTVAETKIFGGITQDQMPSRSPAHQVAVAQRFFRAEREGAPDEPVILNPFRHNVPATYRSIDDFPNLEKDEE
ncbi:hypothetical protein WJX73_001403 [Symbiochloris irregularis]|uniref:Uncharacterized protein n=1 Tax=Symbiochloris irregularis TaxID=706552 RepID=A0AAW1P3B9_9CHLO